MPLVFSPLSEAVLDSPPKFLLPKHAFIMRQLGDPPAIDLEMSDSVKDLFKAKGFKTIDADGSTGGKDYLERIVGLIRSTGFTVAIFSEKTRPGAMANIALELGFAAMCGKPLVIVKSTDAVAPSDLKRTDWIEFDPDKPAPFKRKLTQALAEIEKLHDWEFDLLEIALEAKAPDCAVALERANKGFLLSGDKRFIEAAARLLEVLEKASEGLPVADLERLLTETRAFLRQAKTSLQGGSLRKSRSKATLASLAPAA